MRTHEYNPALARKKHLAQTWAFCFLLKSDAPTVTSVGCPPKGEFYQAATSDFDCVFLFVCLFAVFLLNLELKYLKTDPSAARWGQRPSGGSSWTAHRRCVNNRNMSLLLLLFITPYFNPLGNHLFLYPHFKRFRRGESSKGLKPCFEMCSVRSS